MRFRLNLIGILADIKQALLNVEMSNDQKDFLRFLWYDTNDLKIVIYRFLRVIFGLTSSPFLLNATIRHHLSKYIQFERNFIEKFLEDLYGDGTTSDTKSIEEGKEFYVKTKKMMAEAGFDLRKWKTNSKELQKYFDNKETPIECNNKIVDDLSYLDTEVCSEESTYARVLGVEWDVESDTFVFRFDKFIDLAKSMSATKRNNLKVSASFYDPLGLISPATARVKCIFQLLCKDGYEWDKEVNNEINNIWLSFLADRFCFVNLNEKVILIELNGFADSSNTVYCAVVYLKVVTSAVKVFFLASKTKVIPLKVLNILRLLWCVLLAKLMKEIKEAIRSRVLIDDTYCWTESCCIMLDKG